MLRSMRVSTIAKHQAAGSGTEFSRLLGAEIRRRRLALGLSQDSIGRPLSRAFLSSIESGRTVPSLPSLLMIARKLHSTGAKILASVEIQLEEGGDDADTDQAAIPR
jgi:transcriptional regulator with XRE-family HTH domain